MDRSEDPACLTKDFSDSVSRSNKVSVSAVPILSEGRGADVVLTLEGLASMSSSSSNGRVSLKV